MKRSWTPPRAILILTMALLGAPGCSGSGTAQEPNAQEPSGKDLKSILSKHLEYARVRLNHPDEWVRASALDIVATFDAKGQRDRLRAALDDPSKGPAIVALEHLREIADADDLAAIRRVIRAAADEAQRSRDADPKLAEGGSITTADIVEFSAVEALLVSGTDADQKLAKVHLKRALLGKEQFGHWLLAVAVVGKRRVADLISVLDEPVARPYGELERHIARAKIGQTDSIEWLEAKLSDEKYTGAILRDPALVTLLKLSQENVLPFLKSPNAQLRLDAVKALAHLGHLQHLREAWGRLDTAGELIRGENWPARSMLIECMAAHGDESFVELLDAAFEGSEDDHAKLHASLAIVRIAKRLQAPKRSVKAQ